MPNVPASRRSQAERLTATPQRSPARSHAPHCRSASPSTHRVSGTISPVSSASGTNSPGGVRRPRPSGQRTNVSTHATPAPRPDGGGVPRPGGTPTVGW